MFEEIFSIAFLRGQLKRRAFCYQKTCQKLTFRSCIGPLHKSFTRLRLCLKIAEIAILVHKSEATELGSALDSRRRVFNKIWYGAKGNDPPPTHTQRKMYQQRLWTKVISRFDFFNLICEVRVHQMLPYYIV